MYEDFPIEGGVITDATSKLNNNFSSFMVQRIDSTTDLNVSNSTNNSTVSVDKTFVFTAEEIQKMGDYLLICMNGIFKSNSSSNSSGLGSANNVNIKVENITTSTVISEFTVVNTSPASNSSSQDNNTQQYLELIYLLSEDDRNNGFSVKLTINTVVGNNGGSGPTGSCSYTNRQILFKSINLVS